MKVCPHCGGGSGRVAHVRVSGFSTELSAWDGTGAVESDLDRVIYHDPKTATCADCGKRVPYDARVTASEETDRDAANKEES